VIDFAPVRAGTRTIQELGADLSREDLATAVDLLTADVLDRIAGITDEDVAFVPVDPAADDQFAIDAAEVDLAWTLGHVIVHLTASSEEAAFIAAELARGIARPGRSRWETPWTSVTSAAEVRQRLEESRRMIHALLAAWPDEPHLDVTIDGTQGPRNAIARFLGGLSHADSHREQVSEIVRQAREARSVPAGASPAPHEPGS
jgi:hypothetical protein